MKLKGMDKAVILVCTILLISKLYLGFEILIGIRPQENVIGIIFLLIANVYIIATYPKHRHEYE